MDICTVTFTGKSRKADKSYLILLKLSIHIWSSSNSPMTRLRVYAPRSTSIRRYLLVLAENHLRTNEDSTDGEVYHVTHTTAPYRACGNLSGYQLSESDRRTTTDPVRFPSIWGTNTNSLQLVDGRITDVPPYWRYCQHQTADACKNGQSRPIKIAADWAVVNLRSKES